MATDLKKLLSGEVLDNTEEDTVASPAVETDLHKLLMGDIDPAPATVSSIPDPGRLTAGRAATVFFKEAPKDIFRAVGIGITSQLELTSHWRDWNELENRERETPFSSFNAVDKSQFIQGMVDQGIDPSKLDPVEFAQKRVEYQRERSDTYVKGLQDTRAYIQQKFEADPEYLTSTGWIEDFIRMGPQIGMQVLATLAGGPITGGAFMFAQIAGGKTESLLKQGADFETAATAGMWDAILQTPLEQIGMGKLTKLFSTRTAIVAKMKKALELYGTEFLTEYSQAYPDAATEIWGKNPDAGKMELVKEFLDKITTAEFHAQGAKEGLIAATWSLGIGGKAILRAGPDAQVTDESGTKNQEMETGKPGVQVHVPDTRNETDVRNDAERVPSVETLLGVETDPSKPTPTTPAGVSVSDDLTVTDEQRTNQHQSNDSLNQILGELAGEKAMAKHQLDIDVSQNKLDTFIPFYNDMVEDGDAQGGLQIAQMMEQETNNIINSYTKLGDAATARAANKKMLPDPDKMEQVQNEIVRIKKQSDTRVQAQTTLVQAEQVRERQAYISSLETVDGLQTELIGATNVATRENQPKMAKLYNSVISEMRFRQASGNVDYFSKTPMKKLIDLEVQATLIAQENAATPNIDANVLERDNAINRWIKQQQADRIEYDQVQLVGERMIIEDKVDKAIAAEKVEKTQAAEAKPAVKTIERRRKGEKAQRQRKERTRIQERTGVVTKAKRVVQDQAAKIRKPIPGPTRTKELETAKADKAARVEAIKRQVKEVEAHEPKDAYVDKGTKSVLKDVMEQIDEAPAPARPKMKRESFFRVLLSEAKETLGLGKGPEDIFKVKSLKNNKSKWTILTSDNPGSKTASPAANVKARAQLKAKLDGMGIPYKLGKAKFGKDKEVPFIIPGLSLKGAKKLSKELGQSSFMFGSKKKVQLIEGDKVTTVKKSEIREVIDPNVDHTEIDGEKFTVPFFAESDTMEQISANTGMTVVDFDTMKLKDKQGTLEIMDSLEKEMNLGKWKFLFDKTKKGGIKTVFVTAPGQYGKIPEVINAFPNLKARDDAINRFEQGLKGVFLTGQNIAVINIPSIARAVKQTNEALETVVHEHVHAAHKLAFDEMSALEKNAFGRDLQAVWAGIDPTFLREQRDNPDVHMRIRAGINQVNTSINELVSYSMAHPEFASWLDKIPANSRFKAMSSKIKSVWDALVHLMVTKTLKVPSKLDEVTALLNKHLDLGNRTVRFKAADASFDFGSNVTAENVAEWAKELDAKAKNALPTIVVENAEGMSEVVGFDVTQGGVKDVLGIWTSDGELVINANEISSQEDFVQTWMHEQVAHHGLREVFKDSPALLNRFLDQAFTLFSIKETALIEEIGKILFLGKRLPSGKIVFNKTEKRVLAEEVIARRAEQLKPVTRRGIISRFKAFVKKWLPARFVDVKAPATKGAGIIMTDEDVWDVLLAARENVFTGSNQFGQLLTSAMKKRLPRHKFQGWKNLPDFMESDDTYLGWAAEVLKVAPDLQDWYRQHEEIIDTEFGKDSDLFKILLAVTSPQADVETNVQFAVDTYAYLMGLRDKPGALYANKMKKRIDENWTSPEAMLADLESKNFKVTEFARALLGDQMATVGDMWMFRAFYGDPATFNKNDENFSIPQATGLRQKLHSLAAQMSKKTGKPWSPREMQAAIWVYVNAKQSGKEIGKIASYKSGLLRPTEKYGGKTPVEWLKTLVPNLSEGPLSDRIGLSTISLAPLSPLTKKLLDKVKQNIKGKYPVSTAGDIKTLNPGMTNDDIVKMSNAIVTGGRSLVAPTEDFADWYQKMFGFEKVDDGLDMQLSDAALGLYTNDKGKVTFKMVRDNLGGFSGNYTRAVRFSIKAQEDLGEMAALDSVKNDQEFLATDEDKHSHVNKIHEWRDQSKLNVDRMTNNLEQEFLDKFGGRKAVISRATGVASGRLLHTAESELMAKAMNLYIDSGTGSNLAKVEAFHKKLMSKKDKTLGDIDKLRIMEKMFDMSAGARAWADNNVRPHYEQFFNFAQAKGIIDSHVDNYVKRSWIMPKDLETAGVSWSGTGTTGFKLTPSSGKPRSFDSIVDGWEAGMELRTEGIVGNLNDYANEVGYVYANRRFVDYMKSLVNETGDGIIIERESGVHPPPNYTLLKDRGFARPGQVAYARSDIGEMLNKLGATASHKFWEIPIVKFLRRMNSSIKSTLLSVSMFHHLAGIRSYVFGVTGTGWDRFRPIKAYREGLKKIDEQTGFADPNYQHLGPIVDLLVREGLTFGRTQDWEGDTAMRDSGLEAFLLKQKQGGGAGRALKGWQGLRRWKRQWTNGLFNQLFAGLKAQSGAVELTVRMRKMEKKLGRGLTDAEIKTQATQVARLINADFGGLHLSRRGRNPDFQRVLQSLLLAPDWTESNWRTLSGMVPGLNAKINKAIGDNPPPPGMESTYRHFWTGIAFRGVIGVVAAQFAVLALFGDDDDREEYYKQVIGGLTDREEFAKGRWASVDITPVLEKFGAAPAGGKRVDFNMVGHFKDVFKALSPVQLIKHKQSPAIKVIESMGSRTDWKGDRFKTIGELLDDPTGLVADPKTDPRDAPGWWGGASQLVAAGLYNVFGAVPIPLSEVVAAATGETSLVSGAGRFVGVDVRDVRHRDPAEQLYWKKSQEIKRLERSLDEAKLVRDNRMITAARQDIKGYENFNRTKSRLGFARTRLSPINKKIRALEAAMEIRSLTDTELAKLKSLKRRKADIYEKFADVIGR